MRSLMFVVPVHGRLRLAQICLRQLRRTCDALIDEGIAASAVIVADDNDLAVVAPERLGFATVSRENDFLGRKFNDGIQLATDPRYNPYPADYVVPCGSDDWVDHRIFLDLPPTDTLVGFQRMSFVREDGHEISTSFINYAGGCGIRIIPRELVAALDHRPGDEDRYRGCDTSILRNLRVRHGHGLHVEHRHLHDRQIVDWKTPVTQLNAYTELSAYRVEDSTDPFGELAGVYPADALTEMQELYESMLVAA